MSSSTSAYDQRPAEGHNVVRCGYLKKMKTGRRKWFVLRRETPEAQARLEYYDSEKKYQGGVAPRKSVSIKTCFNINLKRMPDSKHKYVIALYTKDECVELSVDDEGEAEDWFRELLLLQQGGNLPEGETPRPTFAHVWEVHLVNRGLGGTQDLIGNYRLCLREKTLTLIRKDFPEIGLIEVQLSSIRSCGSLQKYVFFEVGRSCQVGPGELWMLTEDQNIAQNIHSTVYHAMTKNSNKDDLGPKSRIRSSSATETSKPNSNKKFYSKSHIFPQDHSQNNEKNESCAAPTHGIQNNPLVSGMVTIYQHWRGFTKSPSERRHSISGGVAFSGSISHQRTQSLPLATPANAPDYSQQQHSRTNKRSNQSKCISSGVGGRERCDSMPSRARTASEGNHPIPMYGGARSHLMVSHRIGASPPIGSPISPPSAAASTDSAGSSFSLVDDTDDIDAGVGGVGRYGHSLTPDEAIAEEDCDSLCAPYGLSPNTGNYMSMAPASSDDGYVDMSPKGRHGNVTPAASLSSVTTSGTPSTDLRFAEYQLDKVMSFFPPTQAQSSDDEQRPIRAYSVGSRPETYKYKKHLMELHGMSESRRDRAASVGSKTKKGPIRVLPPHGHYPQTHPKSSSAPILNAGRIPGSSSSMGSAMDDLMEMDFTNHKKRSFDGYLEMKPGCLPSTMPTPTTTATTHSGYVEMKPGVIPPNFTTSSIGPYMDMRAGTSPSRTSDYTCMDMSRNLTNHHHHHPNPDYMDMSKKPPNFTNNNNINYTNMDFTGAEYHQNHTGLRRSYSQLSPTNYYKSGISPVSDYVDMQCKRNEGYVEMTLGKAATQQQQQQQQDDQNAGKNKNRSLPIQIQNATGKMQLPLTHTTSSSNRRSSSCSSSSTVTTPSNSSTMFPLSLNSPSSPTVTSKTSRTPPEKTTPAVLFNNLYRRIRGKSNEITSPVRDYTEMDFTQTNKQTTSTSKNDDVYVNLDMTKTLNERLSDFNLMNETQTFKPIDENTESDATPQVKKDGASRPGSASSDLCSSTSTLVGSRPDSVNSDSIKTTAAATSASLHYANLDLQAIDDDDDDGVVCKSPKSLNKNDAGTVDQQKDGSSYAKIDFNVGGNMAKS